MLIEVVNLSEFYDKIRRKKYRSHLVTIIITVTYVCKHMKEQ